MDAFEAALNTLLMDTYHSIMKVEEQMLQSSGQLDLSIGELHMIEFIAKDRERGKTISAIAEHQNLTLPSVTVAVNKLVKKGFVEKERCQEDARVVRVKVTRMGRKADSVHRYFHRQMIRSITKELTEEDRASLLVGISKLNTFFEKKLLEMHEMEE